MFWRSSRAPTTSFRKRTVRLALRGTGVLSKRRLGNLATQYKNFCLPSRQPASKLAVSFRTVPVPPSCLKNNGDPRLMLKTILITLASLFLVSNSPTNPWSELRMQAHSRRPVLLRK